MVTRHQIGFLDESGNAGRDFSKPNVLTHFIVGCVLIDEEKVESVRKAIDRIAQQYFSDGEIKSSNIGKNDVRRKKILEEMLELDFQFFAVVVDKRNLTGEGFKYKGSFHKYLNNLVYKELYRIFPRIKLFADEHGGQTFMDGYVKYVKNQNLTNDLIGFSDFSFEPSAKSRLIQLADFMSGTIGRFYNVDPPSAFGSEFLSLLSKKRRLLSIIEFPRRQTHIATPAKLTQQEPVDEIIEESSLRAAHHFLENLGEDDEFVREQAASLEYMLFNAVYRDPTRYISTREFLSNLEGYPDMKANKKNFGRMVIGKLRDGKVLIASNTKGYKLILNREDLDSFVEYEEHYVGPMLRRLKIARDHVRMATMNDFDPLESPKYDYLKRFYDASPLS